MLVRGPCRVSLSVRDWQQSFLKKKPLCKNISGNSCYSYTLIIVRTNVDQCQQKWPNAGPQLWARQKRWSTRDQFWPQTMSRVSQNNVPTSLGHVGPPFGTIKSFWFWTNVGPHFIQGMRIKLVSTSAKSVDNTIVRLLKPTQSPRKCTLTILRLFDS